MNRKSVFFSIVALAWPTILEQAMQTAVSYIDYAMVGKVGTAAIAAVGVSGSNADMPESEFETMAHSVVKAARNISLSMGYVM